MKRRHTRIDRRDLLGRYKLGGGGGGPHVAFFGSSWGVKGKDINLIRTSGARRHRRECLIGW